MPPYLRDIHVPNCQTSGCPKKAAVELRNTYNETIGEFCIGHGEAALAKLKSEDGTDGD